MIHKWEIYFDTTSEYWAKLQKLYKDNDVYPKTIVKGRELHHKFLRCFSRIEGTEVDNDKENLVSLSCGNHFLAHYYIWKCTNKGYRRYTCRPVLLMHRKSLKFITDEIAELIAAEWSEVCKDNIHSEETRKKIGKTSKGRTPWNKGKHHKEETKKKIAETLKGRKALNETRKKQSEAHKGHEGYWKGKHHSEEYKRKMSEAKKGKHWKLVDGKRVWY